MNKLFEGIADSVPASESEYIGEDGLKGVFTGGLTSASFGITVAMLMGFTMALLFQPKG